MSDYDYTSNYTSLYFFFVCNRLHLIKICLCCYLVLHLYSNNLSSITTISSLIISELIPAFFSCCNIFHLSQSSSELGGKTVVFETPYVETNKPGDLGIFIRVLSRVGFLPTPLTSKYICFAELFFNL